jgi:hypothetical protein
MFSKSDRNKAALKTSAPTRFLQLCHDEIRRAYMVAELSTLAKLVTTHTTSEEKSREILSLLTNEQLMVSNCRYDGHDPHAKSFVLAQGFVTAVNQIYDLFDVVCF